MRTWMAAVFSVTLVVNSAKHLRLVLLRSGVIEPNSVPSVPAAISQYAVRPRPSSARPSNHLNQLSPHPITKGYSRLYLFLPFPGCYWATKYDDRHRYQRIATPMSTLPHKDMTRHPSHHMSSVSLPRMLELLWHLPQCGKALQAVPCMLSKDYLHPYLYPTRDSYDQQQPCVNCVTAHH